jgi:hypothetical protein
LSSRCVISALARRSAHAAADMAPVLAGLRSRHAAPNRSFCCLLRNRGGEGGWVGAVAVLPFAADGAVPAAPAAGAGRLNTAMSSGWSLAGGGQVPARRDRRCLHRRGGRADRQLLRGARGGLYHGGAYRPPGRSFRPCGIRTTPIRPGNRPGPAPAVRRRQRLARRGRRRGSRGRRARPKLRDLP